MITSDGPAGQEAARQRELAAQLFRGLDTLIAKQFADKFKRGQIILKDDADCLNSRPHYFLLRVAENGAFDIVGTL